MNSKPKFQIELRKPCPGASDATITTLEKSTGIKIPPDYRAFLKSQNGGEPKRRNITFGNKPYHDTVLRSFFGINVPRAFDLATVLNEYTGRIPSRTFPIADDEFGNMILIDRRRGAANKVLFWDHEMELQENEPIYVAADLSRFLGKLEEDEIIEYDIAMITYIDGRKQRRVLPFRFFSIDRNAVVDVQSLTVGEQVKDFGVTRTIAKIDYSKELDVS